MKYRLRILELDESTIGSLNIEGKYDTIAISNHTGKAIDERTFYTSIQNIKGIENVTSFLVRSSSTVTNLTFMKSLSNLESLQLYGYRLKTLDGLELLENLKIIKIDTGKNHKRNIERISQTKILKLVINWVKKDDTDAIGQCSMIQDLTITNCSDLSLKSFDKVPIECLTLYLGKFEQFGNTFDLKYLKKLILNNCRKLQSFVGVNNNIDWMIVESCNKIAFQTIHSFKNIKYLYVVNIKNELKLGDFVGLSKLQELSIQNSKISINLTNLKVAIPQLRNLTITNIKKHELENLSQINPGVLISNGVVSYRNGNSIPS